MATKSRRAIGTKKSAILEAIPEACSNELAAVEFIEAQRWGDTPNCPRCGDVDVAMMKAKDGSRNARFLWRCYGCKRQYTVKIGSVMEDSKIPFRFWCLAFYRACASKKGVSALQIQRETELTYRSALFLMHRVRAALAPANECFEKLTGICEVDETYVGGKPRGVPNWALHKDGRRKPGPAKDFRDRKTPVVASVQRGGRVKAHVVTNVTPVTLANHVRSTIDPTAVLVTDERSGYKNVGQEYADHRRVAHHRAQWADGDTYTNTIEGFFSLIKRSMYGTYHSVSRKHLHRYVAQSEFMYNTKHVDDGERTALAIQGADHKRLTYKEQVGK